MGFAAPSRLVLEYREHRLAMYVTNFETDTIWLIASHDVSFLKAKSQVRMIVRSSDGPSLGLRGKLAWVARDRLAITVEDQFDRSIVTAWKDGKVADLSAIGSSQDLLRFDDKAPDALSSPRPPDSNWYGITLDDTP